MKLYVGIDLHSTNSYVAVLDETDKVVYQKRLSNDVKLLLNELSPYRESIVGIVVESTYNWYWLVDNLQEKGYQVHLANTAKNEQYKGLKHTDDKSDAIWLAHLLRLGLLSCGYIYPKEDRGLRELLRRRLSLVRQQTMMVLGIQSLITRPGVGPILAMTILLEAGDIKRFKQAGHFSSYCRCVESKRTSNHKKKDENNRRNGNAYLSWAFIEASNYAIRYYEPAKRCYQRKLEKSKRVVALKMIANKLSKASYFMLRDNVEFDMKKAFG